MIPSRTGYGEHPTIYGSLEDNELYAMYRGDIWFGLNETQRQQLLQETVNREAERNGELGSCEVLFEDMDPCILGEQSAGVIRLNRDAYVEDKRVHTYNGQTIEEPFTTSNYNALETVIHEDIHAWQNQCIEGTIECTDQDLLNEYRANNFTDSPIADENGEIQNGSQYLNGVTPGYGYYMYYFQSTERDAHFISEKRTLEIMRDNAMYGEDPSADRFLEEVSDNGYIATKSDAEELFGDEDFDHGINNTLMNKYYGTKLEADPEVEKLVEGEMIESYNRQHGMRADNEEDLHQTAESATDLLLFPDEDVNNTDSYNELLDASEQSWSETISMSSTDNTGSATGGNENSNDYSEGY